MVIYEYKENLYFLGKFLCLLSTDVDQESNTVRKSKTVKLCHQEYFNVIMNQGLQETNRYRSYRDKIIKTRATQSSPRKNLCSGSGCLLVRLDPDL
jgi:hypothetical protein